MNEITPSTVFSLRELTSDELSDAAARLDKADRSSMTIVGREVAAVIERCLVQSGANMYEVTIMGTWVSCTCPGWELGHKACKHIALCLPPLCRTCTKRWAAHLGDQCSLCGPGELLPVGTRFTCKRYYGKRAVLEVIGLDLTQSVCVDITTPGDSSVPRCNHYFNLIALDLYRNQGDLKIVERTDLEIELEQENI